MKIENKGLYTAKIIRVPALLNDTKIFLSSWDESLTIDDNFRKATEENIFGRPARSYVKQFLKAFKERYIVGDERDEALRSLIKRSLNDNVVNRILYYHTARADILLHDFVTDYLYRVYKNGNPYISTKEAQLYIKSLSSEGKTTSKWNDTVCNRVARNILTTLRDFLILDGNVKKKIAPVHLPVEVFVYVSFSISRYVTSGNKIIDHEDWRLFLIDPGTVEQLFLEAHQQGYLKYHAAGNVVRIEYPYKKIEEVVDDIVS